MKSPIKSEDEPCVILGDCVQFLGKPTQCLGHVHLHNRSDEKVRIKEIPLVEPRLRGPADVSAKHLRVSASLLPGAALQARAQLQIPPHTPPGRYTAEVLVGNVRTPVTIDVLESWDLAINPTRLELKLHLGDRPTCLVHLTNRGNMPWNFPRAALAPLEERDAIHPNIFLSLTKTAEPTFEGVLNDFVKRMRMSEVEPAKVKILSETDVLPPGETQELQLEISLPANVKKNRRYGGVVHFDNAALRLDIEVLGNSAQTRSRSHEKIRRPTPTSR
jgi:hypothetical protein